jgi:predicted permease
MPHGFNFADVYPDIIVPAQFDRAQAVLPGFAYSGLARLRAGADLKAADADVARLIPLWMRSWRMVGGLSPLVYENWRITPVLQPLKQDVVGSVARVLWVTMGTVGLLLLIACANVAGLLLVRADAKQQELRVRAALGAGRARLIRGLAIESLLLGLAAGVVGLALAAAGLQVLAALHPPNLPRLTEIAIDARVLVFAIAVSMAASLMFGLVPSWRAVGAVESAGLAGGVRGSIGSRDRRRLRDVLVASQMALAVVLLVGSGLMVRSVRALGQVDPGFAGAAEAETLQTTISERLVPDGPRLLQLEHDIVDRVAAAPGVTAAGFTNAAPLDTETRDWDDIEPEGRDYKAGDVPPFRLFKWISPGYFRAVGTPIVAGRDYEWTDLAERRPVAIVSLGLAREFWGSAAGAIGRRVRTLDTSPWREVIGVAGDTRDNGMDQPPPATVYWPAYTESLYKANGTAVTRSMTIVVRSARAGTADFVGDLRRALGQASPDLPIASVQTMAAIYDASLARPSFALTMLTAAAAIGLLLGVVGLYGVVSYAGSQRRREVGVRVALGADRRSVTRLFLRQGLVIVAAGVAVGLPAALVASRLIQSLLFETRPLDPATYATVVIVLCLAAAAASYVPARRAAAIDPVRALRD